MLSHGHEIGCGSFSVKHEGGKKEEEDED